MNRQSQVNADKKKRDEHFMPLVRDKNLVCMVRTDTIKNSECASRGGFVVRLFLGG